MSELMEAILNPERIEALRDVCDGEDDLVIELADLYRDEIPKRVADLVAAANAGRLDVVKQIAHFVKGASANVGAEQLAAICVQLETAAIGGDVALAGELARRVDQYFPLVVEALQATIGNR